MMTITDEWSPHTITQRTRERRARIAAAAKVERPAPRPEPQIPTVKKILPGPIFRRQKTWFDVLEEICRDKHGTTSACWPVSRIEDIQHHVAFDYGVTRAAMLSELRTNEIVRPRQVSMYLARTLTLRSTVEIGRKFGGRDHTTVMHAVRKIEHLIATDPELAARVNKIKERLRNV